MCGLRKERRRESRRRDGRGQWRGGQLGTEYNDKRIWESHNGIHYYIRLSINKKKEIVSLRRYMGLASQGTLLIYITLMLICIS